MIGDRLHAIREEKKISRDDLEKRLGLFTGYLALVEDGCCFPSLATVEKLADALSVPLHQLFYTGGEPPPLPNLPGRLTCDDIAQRHPKA